MNIAYNRDCLEAMKEYPDKYFDLAIVDPPYGDGSQNVQVERERERANHTITGLEDGSTNTKPTRTGGTWAAKFAKKS
jgi:site-specific DNA-methyltransferase (adenine-specific)